MSTRSPDECEALVASPNAAPTPDADAYARADHGIRRDSARTARLGACVLSATSSLAQTAGALSGAHLDAPRARRALACSLDQHACRVRHETRRKRVRRCPRKSVQKKPLSSPILVNTRSATARAGAANQQLFGLATKGSAIHAKSSPAAFANPRAHGLWITVQTHARNTQNEIYGGPFGDLTPETRKDRHSTHAPTIGSTTPIPAPRSSMRPVPGAPLTGKRSFSLPLAAGSTSSAARRAIRS
jgi:hypothetical protein